MTYQALARKWRPKTFAELAGQEHVVTALTNALARGRLHHAYLLTGTRGVGKTTIARILAKSLNCITHGVTATPCGTCAACLDIDAGRFVDLLELDAASNTGIDNMREVLDNARYMPTVGRFKVYLIDEVHMLSKAAFNSMLKTLEEPPEHVKFVLATTDPQKIPVTVLSRCLQFNLKQLPPSLIVERLAAILAAEAVPADAAALALIARAAHGSMRDALSLLDQAIAYGGGEVREVVRTMLGAVDTEYVYRIVDALNAATVRAVREVTRDGGAHRSAGRSRSSRLFHRSRARWCLLQRWCLTMPSVSAFAAACREVQLAHQICAQVAPICARAGRSDRLLMTLLRLLAFEPAGGGVAATRRAAARTTMETSWRTRAALAAGRERRACCAVPAPRDAVTATSAVVPSESPASIPAEASAKIPLPLDVAGWPSFVAGLKLAPMAAQLAAQTELKAISGNVLTLALPAAQRHLADKAYADKLKAGLEHATGRKLMLAFEVGSTAEASLAAQKQREQAEQKSKTEAEFRGEPFVRDLLERFDAKIRPDSIKPIS
jgi:DNA polymerase-3 subunit gamma/tau